MPLGPGRAPQFSPLRPRRRRDRPDGREARRSCAVPCPPGFPRDGQPRLEDLRAARRHRLSQAAAPRPLLHSVRSPRSRKPPLHRQGEEAAGCLPSLGSAPASPQAGQERRSGPTTACAAKANSQPPPSAAPFRAATTGLGQSSMALQTSGRNGSSSGPSNSRISAPASNTMVQR